MAVITQLCSKAILLANGHLQTMDTSSVVVAKYLESSGNDLPEVVFADDANKAVSLRRCWIGDAHGQGVIRVDVTEPFTVNLQVSVHKSIQGGDIGIRFYNSFGYPLFTTSLTDTFLDYFNFLPCDH